MSKTSMGWKSVMFSTGCLDPLICICASHSWHPSIRLTSQEQGVCPRVLRPGHGGSIFPVQSRTLSAESLIARVHCLYLILSRVPCSICSRRMKLVKAGSTSPPTGWGQLAYKPRTASLSRAPTTTTRPTRCHRRPAPPRR